MKTQTQERIDMPTPNGGAYSIAYYFDADKKPCAKQAAAFIEIVEYDDKDSRLYSTYSELYDGG